MLEKVKAHLLRPVDIASLVVFRVAFGFIMLVEVWRYYTYGWIERYYISPTFYFKYYGFEWVEPWAGDGMYWHFALLAITAFMIMIGLFFRVASVVFVLLFSYVFLLDQTQYLNHFYFVILLAVLLCLSPAHRSFSVDSKLFPNIAATRVPAWALWALVAQIEVMYLYAGIVKINPDWLQLQPLTMWLANSADWPLIGPFLEEQWMVALASYGVILLHVVGAPLLLFKRTRLWVFLIYATFHTLNHFQFQIGIFPWLTLVGTTLFFDPDWPRQIEKKLMLWMSTYIGRRGAVGCGETSAELHSRLRQSPVRIPADASAMMPGVGLQRWIFGFLGVWFFIQVFFPLRHLLYDGSPSWTEEGHRFAWQMKLRDKYGRAQFTLTDPATGKSWKARPRDYLSRRQIRKMGCRPDMILQFAHYLAEQTAARNGGVRPEVRVSSRCALNGRPKRPLIDNTVDLAKVERNLLQASWILPLNTPLPPAFPQGGKLSR